MRAVVLKGFGGLEMLEERDLPVPEPGPGEVLVRNLAVAVNPVDAKIRAAGRWAGVEPPFVLGYDAAGKLVELRPGTNDLICLADTPGDDKLDSASAATLVPTIDFQVTAPRIG